MDFSKAVIIFTGQIKEPCALKHRAQALGAKVLSKLPEPITGLDYYLVYGDSPATLVVRAAREREMTIMNLPYLEDELTKAERPSLNKSSHDAILSTLKEWGLALKGVDYQNIDLKGPAQAWIRLWARDVQQWVQVRRHDVEAIEKIVKAAPPEGAVVAYVNLENGNYAFFDEIDRAHEDRSRPWLDAGAEALATWKQFHRIPLDTYEWVYDDLTEAQRHVAVGVMTELADEFGVSWCTVEAEARSLRFHGPQDFADKLRTLLTNPLRVGDGRETLSPEGTEPLLKVERILAGEDARRLNSAMVPPLDPDCYDDWLAMGARLHRICGGSEEGRKAWHQFSKHSPKYRADQVDSRWPTFGHGAGDAQIAEQVKDVEHQSCVPPEDRKAAKLASFGTGYGPARGTLHRFEVINDPGKFTHRAADEFEHASTDVEHPYHSLASVLLDAFEQAAMGKGKERHANDLPFTEQKMQTICKSQGHLGGMIYQVAKKALEAEKMAPEKRIHELGGVIVYAAGAIIFTQRQEKQS